MSENAENLWGFTVDTPETSGGQYLEPGIHEEVFFTKLEVVSDPQGKHYLQIEMADINGLKVSGRFYEPVIDHNRIKNNIELKERIDKLMKVFANLGRKFKGDNYVVSGGSFKELCTNLISDIGAELYSKPLRTKVVYNNKDFISLPVYPPIWEDPTLIPKSESKLRINSIDNVTKTNAKAAADNDTEPAPTGAASWAGV